MKIIIIFNKLAMGEDDLMLFRVVISNYGLV